MLELLARFAENSFWMARYMERAENLARTIDVNETFAQNSEGLNEWLPIVQLYADADRFFASHGEATADAVLHFYLLDRENPNSLVSTVYTARENARSLRHLVSTETWTHLNVFYNRLLELQPRDLALSRLSRLCQSVKEDCQLHTGIIEGTGYRDQTWYIYQIGKYLERMDQTTRLLDINYHRLLPPLQQVGTEIDASRWNAVLRSVAAYHAFRRVHPRGMSPTTVAGFLLFDRGFQRSIAVCIETVDEMFMRLSSLTALSNIAPAQQTLATLRAIGKETSIEQVVVTGLHEFLDHLQQLIIVLSDQWGLPCSAIATSVPQLLSINHETVCRYRRPVTFNEHRAVFRHSPTEPGRQLRRRRPRRHVRAECRYAPIPAGADPDRRGALAVDRGSRPRPQGRRLPRDPPSSRLIVLGQPVQQRIYFPGTRNRPLPRPTNQCHGGCAWPGGVRPSAVCT